MSGPQGEDRARLPTRDWFELRPFMLVLALAIFFAFPDVLFGLKTFFYRDYAVFGYPLAFYHKKCFWRGEIPLWNPYNNCGIPFLAQWNTLTLYPLSLVYLLLPLPWSLSFFCLLHLFIGGIGAYVLARAWTNHSLGAAVAGIAFSFGGLAFSCLKWPNNIAALGWLPWILWASERGWMRGGRHLGWAALLGALQMLTGAPEIILFTWILTGALMLFQWSQAPRSRSQFPLRLAAMVCLVTGMSAAQLLPFLELLQHSQRGVRYSDASWAMPAWGLANFVVPLFRCFPSHQGVFAQFGQYWISSYYSGIGVLLLVLVGAWKSRDRKAVFLVTVSVAGTILSMGPSAGFYSLLRSTVPFLGFVRFPIKFVTWTAVLLPILAAYGVMGIESAPSAKNARTIWISAAVLFGSLGLILACGWWNPIPVPGWDPDLERKTLALNAGSRALFLAGCSGILLLVLQRGFRPVLGFGLLGCLAADLLTQAPRLNPVVEPWVLQPSPADLAILNMAGPPPRLGESRAMLSAEAEKRLDHLAFTNAIEDVLYSRKALFSNCNLIDSIPKVDGFYSLYVKEENSLRTFLDTATGLAVPPLLDFLGVTQITAPGKIIDWKARPSALPFLSAGQAAIFVTNRAEALRRMLGAPFEPRQKVFIELPAANARRRNSEKRDSVAISAVIARPHSISAQITSRHAGYVIVSQVDYPGWKAFVDEEKARIERANYAYQAIEVPAGTHQLKLKFHSASFDVGAGISAVSLVLAIALILRRSQRG